MTRLSGAALPIHFIKQIMSVTNAIASMACELAGQLARQGAGANERSKGVGPADERLWLVRTAGRPVRSRQTHATDVQLAHNRGLLASACRVLTSTLDRFR
jgi:hypothetical protein